MLRRFAPPLVALAAFACTPSVPQNPSPVVDYAAFDPTSGVFPVPNDLALQFAGLVPGAQGELLQAFAAQLGFPYDQVLPVSIDLVREDFSQPAAPVKSAPPLDLASIVPCTARASPGNCNLLVLDATAAPVEYTPVEASYRAGTSAGTLALTRVGAGGKPVPWRPGGNYIVALRGGPNGVKTVGGGAIAPSVTMYAILFSPAADLPSDQARALQAAYQPLFAAVENRGFPKADIAVVASFPIAPATTWVKADPTTGDMPLPSDFLFDLSTGHITASLDALIPGISTLDGFSTTAMVFAETSGPVQAATIRSSAGRGAYLYDLSTPAAPVLVPDVVDFLAAPATTAPVYAAVTSGPTVQGGFTTLVGLQPAVGIGTPAPPGDPPTQISLPPLKEKTRYAVVVTDAVQNASGQPLSRTTLGTILMLTNPICVPTPACTDPTSTSFPGTPTLLGVSAVDAAGLESQRLALQPVLAKLAADFGVTKAHVAFPWTFRTQTVSAETAQLPLLPFAGGGFGIKPGAVSPLTRSGALKKHGVDPAMIDPAIAAAGVPPFGGAIETTIPTVNLLDPYSGAFDPVSANWRLKDVPVLMALPAPAAVASMPNCLPAPLAAVKCVPLVVFGHGLGRSRADMLLAADVLAARGFAVAAIDAPLHGDRSFCRTNADCVTDAGTDGTCTPVAPPGTPQGSETPPPGTCTNLSVLKKAPPACLPAGVGGSTCIADWAAAAPSGRGGTALTSGAYFISGNPYRTRDAMRQHLVDVSALALALARPPPPFLPALPGTGSEVVNYLVTQQGLFVNPGQVYYEGQSFGAILGALNAAVDQRLSRVVLNVGGGTVTDVFTQSPAFQRQIANLLASLGIAPGSPEYLLLIQTFKWVLDPAEPLNFAGTVKARRLATPPPPLAHADVLGQWAACDQTVLNPFTVLLLDNIGLGPAAGGTSSSVLYANSTRQGPACLANGGPVLAPNPGTLQHGFLLDWGLGTGTLDTNDLALTLAGQGDAAAFLLSPLTLPPPVQVRP